MHGSTSIPTIKHCIHLLKLSSSSIKHLFQIHAQIQISGLQSNTYILSELVRHSSLTSSPPNPNYARIILYNSPHSVPSTWNMVIRSYASSNSPIQSISVFHEMRNRGIKPNELTFPFLIKACATCSALKEGKQVQVEVIKHGLDSDVYVGNNLVHFYGSCKKILDAMKVFDEMRERTVVSWNAMITSCVENLRVKDGIGYLVEMMGCGFDPDETTMVVVLSGCGNMSLGRWVHSQVISRGLVLNCQLGTALIDMYSKTGGLDYAKMVFSRMDERNVWTWSAMVLGLAQHGFAHEALELFTRMKKSKSCLRPNHVTFLGVLCACSHAGLVDDGFRYFHEMVHKHKINPMMIHYGAMVDILGRAGRLKEAYVFIKNMPVGPDPVVLRTLLSACSVHSGNDDDGVGVGEKVRKWLLEMEPRRSGNLVMVANMYADVGLWDRAANVRRVMKDGGMKKMAGESFLEVGGTSCRRRFFSGCDYENELDGVYELLRLLNSHMKMLSLE